MGTPALKENNPALCTVLCCLLSAMLVLMLVPALLPHNCTGEHCTVCSCARVIRLASPLLLVDRYGALLCPGRYCANKNRSADCGSVTPVKLNIKLLI